MDWISLVTIPLFSGAIGYATNWTGVWMLFHPLHFRGFRLPGLAPLARLLPRKIQQVPGVMVGGVGWQGIIPSRAAKMGSIAVDKGIAKVGNPREFYDRLDRERLAQHVLESSREEIGDLVERVMVREHPRFWRDLPPQLRARLHRRVQEQLPQLVPNVIDEIGDNIDDLLDVKLMVIKHIEAHPELANKVFGSVGDKELKLIVNLGFVFGFVFGIPVALLTAALDSPWVLLVFGPIVGWVTNWLAILMIFEPVTPRKIGPIRLHGLFLRRQYDASDVYAHVIADDIVTVRNIAVELLHGARADKTRLLIANALRPAIDRAAGPLLPAVRLAMGTREYDAIREGVAAEGVKHTITPLTDPEFNRRQARQVHALIVERMRELPPADFSEMMRSAMREDEWLLLAHGAVLGVVGGLAHLAAFG
ncbi:MAG TPA: hypothetical protein VGJ32_14060 [Solirubrobacteraceae bacterium]